MSKLGQTKPINGWLRTLEDLSFTGNCIIAEINRISLIIPNDFVDSSSSEFNKLLIDFSYFENRANFDNFVEKTEEGTQLDREFYTKHANFLHTFGRFVDNFYNFLLDITDFSSEFSKWKERINRAKLLEEIRLGAQVLHLLGIIILLINHKFPGGIRERIFVAFYRLRVSLNLHQLEVLVNFFRARQEAYETSFLNIGIDEYFIRRIIAFLCSFKGYCHGWMENALYVCLYFEPGHDSLHNQFSFMRQIVDNYFTKRWVLHLHVDFQINLHEKWERFKAANAALSSSCEVVQARSIADQNLNILRTASFPTGLLSLEMFENYEQLIIDSNKALRWLLLHFSKDTIKNKRMSGFFSKDAIAELLSHLKQLANFEYKFKQACKYLQNNHTDCVNKLRQRISENFSQIITFLRSSNSSKNDKRIERIISWLESLKISIEEMDPSRAECGSHLDNLRVRISEVLHYQAGGDQQQRLLHQFLQFALSDFQRLQNLCRLDDAFLVELDKFMNASYLFKYVEENCSKMEELLQKDALSVKYIFLKIADSVPLLVSKSANIEKRKKLFSFYYKLLENKLRAVIQAVPRAIFNEMDKLNEYFPIDVSSVAVEKIKIREFADLPRRMKLADLTYQISKLALGISNTCIKQLGDVEIQPRSLLRDGLKKELNMRLHHIIGLEDQPNLISSLQNQSVKLCQFRRTFLFVCDHVDIRDGIQMWMEQIRLILGHEFRKQLARTKEDRIAPISSSSKISTPQLQLIEKLFNFMMSATTPNSSIYLNMESNWRATDTAYPRIKFTHNFFAALESWQMFGLNIYTAIMLAKELLQLNALIDKTNFDGPVSLPNPMTTFSTNSNLPEIFNPYKELLCALAKLGQLWILFKNLQLFVKAELYSQLGIVQKTMKILKRIEKLEKRLGLRNWELSGDNDEFINLILKSLKFKHTKAHVFLVSTILHSGVNKYWTISSNKRPEKIDSFAIMEGAKLMLLHSHILNLFLIDGRNLLER